jgi:two-component system chemotaxis sensor kinase CheA
MPVSNPGPMAGSNRPPRITIQGLRRLILVVMTFSVLGFTVGVFVLVQRIFDNFGPAVEKDLDWKTLRGSQELARAADLGLALSDVKIVTQAFGDYRKVEDVIAIVAMNSSGETVAIHGNLPETVEQLFSGSPVKIRRTPGYLVAWASAVVEGNTVGKIALAISTRRLVQSEIILRRISYGTMGVGIVALVFGILFVNFFTRSIAMRDAQLAEYATGLEKKVTERTVELDQRNRGMRLVLDNVTQGFITVGLDGVMSSERSSIVDRWFGIPDEKITFADYLRSSDTNFADWFTLGLQSLAEDLLPRELLIDQLPKRLMQGHRTMSLCYTPILTSDGNTIERILVVITDITDELAREIMERDTREMSRIFQRASSDRSGAEQFFAEAEEIVRKIIDGQLDGLTEKRQVHTLKGNCALFGIESLSQLCHEIESRLVDEGGNITPTERTRINNQWKHVSNLARAMMGERRSTIELEEVDIQELIKALRNHAPHDSILAITESWRHEAVSLRFGRLADKAVYLAKRLGKPAVIVHTETCGVRLEPTRWAPFWSSFIHVINNAVDHGIEDPGTRTTLHKPTAGNLWMTALREDGMLVISLRDDGRGIDWQRIKEKANERKLPNATHADLVEAMFADGISTRETATQTSGRGVGLAALQEATLALGGKIHVQSELGKGTVFEFRFGKTDAAA